MERYEHNLYMVYTQLLHFKVLLMHVRLFNVMKGYCYVNTAGIQVDNVF